MEQKKLRIEQEILEIIENNSVTLSEREVNPMGLPDIDPVTNPASDNCLTRELVYQLGLGIGINNISDLTQEDFNKLKGLDIRNNELTEIPKEIGNLTNLQTVFLDNNQLTELPTELSNLTNLKYFLLNDQNVKLDNKCIQPSKEFTIQNPISVFGNPVVSTNISNNGVYNPADNTITWLASDENRDETFSFSQAVTIGSATKDFARTVTLPTIIVEE